MAPRSVADKRHLRERLDAVTRARVALARASATVVSSWRTCIAAARRVPGLGSFLRLLSSLTVLGWGTAIIGAGASLAGVLFSWVEAAVLGFTCLTLVALSLLWSLGRAGHAVALRLANTRVTVGEKALGALTVSNPTARRLRATMVELRVGAGANSFLCPALGRDENHEEVFAIATTRRGVVAVGPASTIRGDGLGLLRREQNWVEAQELYVHPRTVNVASNAIGFIRDIEGATTHDLSSSDVAFHALREYLPGDDRRNVHWRTTARTGRLMVRQFEESRRAHLLIVFDDDARSWHNYREYELGVSVAASIGAAVIRERRDLSFTSQLGPVPTSSPNAFLDGLTKIEPKAGVERLGDLARIATDREPQASVVAVVTGSRPEASELHRAHAALPVNARSFALRIHEAERVSRALVGGFPIVTIPSLDSLPLALRKAVS